MKKHHLIILIILTTVIAFFLVGCQKDQNEDNNDPETPPVFPNCGTVTDIDGNTYKTVTIGNQCWMRENLKTTQYKNGDLIGTTATPSTSISDEEIPKYEWILEGNTDYLDTYGRIYTWYVTVDPRGLCPAGWHIPTDSDWQQLEIALGMSPDDVANEGARGFGTGSKLAGQKSLWNNPNSSILIHEDFGTSGFDGLPGGARNPGGYPVSPGYSTYWWSSTPGLSTQYDSSAYARYITSERNSITRVRPITHFGLYVRCVKD